MIGVSGAELLIIAVVLVVLVGLVVGVVLLTVSLARHGAGRPQPPRAAGQGTGPEPRRDL